MEISNIAGRIAQELQIPESGVSAVLSLLDDGGTVPFIARYRKEATGYLDEVAILNIRDKNQKIQELEKRREAILASCEEMGVLNDALRRSVTGAATMAELEDAYLPYRPKRKTRASTAKEKGLEGLAVHLMKQKNLGVPLDVFAQKYVSPERGVECADDALAGARDIIAESVAEHPNARQRLRNLFFRRAEISAAPPKKSKASAEAADAGSANKFQDYYDSQTNVAHAPSHRILALLRGEREGALKLKIEPDEGVALDLLRTAFLKGHSPESEQVDIALKDAYKRLLAPAMETELRAHLKERADEEAIEVFASNLHAILMASPFGGRRTLALDPGFRSGCKLVVLNEQGKLLHNETIYPHPPQNRSQEAAAAVRRLVETYRPEAAAIGNGTAGRETEAWMRGLDLPIQVLMVNESGASVYSASDVARAEFPDLDLTVRGAVSIGRRMQDPLAELVKIDPKSIGVGQYQHDVDQKRLRASLDDVVASCVNQVGVEVNSASRELLKYVSGLNQTLASNIVRYRDENGRFDARSDLRKVPRMGPKAFEQAAGFLRIRDGSNPLDASAVHPENYAAVKKMARDLDCSVADLMEDAALREKIDTARYADVGEATLRDILSELAKPGRDPRTAFEAFSFDENVHEPADLKPGMTLPGIVSNITDFGAFVDVGVHLDGLLHRSKLKGKEAKNIAPGSRIYVEVLAVDLERKRISLGMAKE